MVSGLGTVGIPRTETWRTTAPVRKTDNHPGPGGRCEPLAVRRKIGSCKAAAHIPIDFPAFPRDQIQLENHGRSVSCLSVTVQGPPGEQRKSAILDVSNNSSAVPPVTGVRIRPRFSRSRP